MANEKNFVRKGGLSAFKSRCEKFRGMDFMAERHDLYGLTAAMLDWHWRNVSFHNIGKLTLILPRSHTGTVWFYTSTSNKRAARPKLYIKSLTGDLKRMYSRLTLVRISIKL